MSASNRNRQAATRAILGGSALVLGALGLALLFAPDEVSRAFGWGGGVAAPSVAAGGLLAIAVLDWTGRGAIFGGVYGRPIVLANLTIALTAGLALAKLQMVPGAPWLGWLPVTALTLHGFGFALILLGRVGGPGGA